MNRIRFIALTATFPLLAMLGGCRCGSGDSSSCTESGTTNYYVNASSGSDSNDGSRKQPFKTITKAVSLATSGKVINVAPGTYDAANGEIFPIVLATGVSLIGDEPNKGRGKTATKIIGSGAHSVYTTWGSTIELGGVGITIAGFLLTNNSSSEIPFAMTIGVNHDSLTLRNNSIVEGLNAGIYVAGGSKNHTIKGNVIAGHASGVGLIFRNSGGAGSTVEDNVITGNAIGVEYDSIGGDMGDGSAGSTGGNTISCNMSNDLWTNSTITIKASKNFWDHSPPSEACGNGGDICNSAGTATIDTSNPGIAGIPCTSSRL